IWEEANRQGAIYGYAHQGIRFGARIGLAMDVPDKLLTFLEVFSSPGNAEGYDMWYEILNLGYRMTPISGTDLCRYNNGKVAGWERFYTRVEGPLTYESWMEGIRRGRTFTTSGPLLALHVEGKQIGDTLVLEHPRKVVIAGSVQFDPEQQMLE